MEDSTPQTPKFNEIACCNSVRLGDEMRHVRQFCRLIQRIDQQKPQPGRFVES
jgi:hypothetical protein